jgi:glucan 1,3-beta-glucosidase
VDAGGDGTTGSLSVIDSFCDDCGAMVNGSSSFILENISNKNSGPMLKTDGQDQLTGDLLGQTYAVGHLQTSNNGSVEVSAGRYLDPTARGNLVDDQGYYFTKSQPQYADWDISSFSSVKDCGAKGKSHSISRTMTLRATYANTPTRRRPNGRHRRHKRRPPHKR